MKMLAYDLASPGGGNVKPKGTIELIQIGEHSSIAQITKASDPSRPIRPGGVPAMQSRALDPDRCRFGPVARCDRNVTVYAPEGTKEKRNSLDTGQTGD
jgi:hypothetical protein